MNPTALILVTLALLLLVIAFKGTQDNFMSALLARPWSSAEHLGTTSTSSPTGSNSAFPNSANPPSVSLA